MVTVGKVRDEKRMDAHAWCPSRPQVLREPFWRECHVAMNGEGAR